MLLYTNVLHYVKQQWKFSLQEQYLFMLDSFRDAIVGRSETDVPPRIPPAITISVARGFSILAKPTHYMYLHYEKWLTQRPTLSLQVRTIRLI